jgi:hypothetical protein
MEDASDSVLREMVNEGVHTDPENNVLQAAARKTEKSQVKQARLLDKTDKAAVRPTCG